MHACMCVFMYVCGFVNKYPVSMTVTVAVTACMYVHVRMYRYLCEGNMYVYVYVRMYRYLCEGMTM